MQSTFSLRTHPLIRSLILFGFLTLLFSFCLWLLLVWMFRDFIQTHPTDKALITNFHTHKAEFNQLLQMFQADAEVHRIAQDFTDVPIPGQRWNDYRHLFYDLGLEAGIAGYAKKEVIRFYFSSRGLATSGSSKGYVYTQQTPTPVVDDLDLASSEDGETIYRHIEGNWYLYYEWT